jgi:hypothetical protein
VGLLDLANHAVTGTHQRGRHGGLHSLSPLHVRWGALPSLVPSTSVIRTDYLSMVLRCAPLLLCSHPYMEKCVIPEIFSLHACILYVPRWWVCYHVRSVDKTFCTSAMSMLTGMLT